MQIPHEEARRLIQFNEDEALSLKEKAILSTHLKTCFECRAYAADIREVENTLLPIMKRQWDFGPALLSLAELKAKKHTKASTRRNMLAIRTAIISFVFIGFLFSAWHFTRSNQQFPGLSPLIVSSVPTPSYESTNTSISSESCYLIRYTVQANDTLASIAEKFSLSEVDLIASNDLKTESLYTGITLIVPICQFTPTGVAIETISTTLTPVISSATSSPEPTRY